MKKAKVIKRELQEQMLEDDFNDIKVLSQLVQEFIKEFNNLGSMTSDVVIINKAKELDNKFKNSLPDGLKHYSPLFKQVLLKYIPILKGVI